MRGPGRITITFDDAEMEEVRRIAELRGGHKVEFASSRFMNSDPHFVGVIGEAAFAKAFGFKVDTSSRVNGDDGVDFTSPAGLTIDVQTASYDPPILKYDRQHPFRADVAVLCLYDGASTVDICSYVKRDQFGVMKYTKDFGWGERDCASESDMTQLVAP